MMLRCDNVTLLAHNTRCYHAVTKKLCIFWRLKSQDDTIHILTSIGQLRVFTLENWLTKRNSTVVINISTNGIIHAKKDERSESL